MEEKLPEPEISPSPEEELPQLPVETEPIAEQQMPMDVVPQKPTPNNSH